MIQQRHNYFILESESANVQRQQDQQQVELMLKQLPIALIRQAYRDALPVDVDRAGSESIDPIQVVAVLQDLRRLLKFVQAVVA